MKYATVAVPPVADPLHSSVGWLHIWQVTAFCFRFVFSYINSRVCHSLSMEPVLNDYTPFDGVTLISHLLNLRFGNLVYENDQVPWHSLKIILGFHTVLIFNIVSVKYSFLPLVLSVICSLCFPVRQSL